MQTARPPLPLASQRVVVSTSFEEVAALYAQFRDPIRFQLPARSRAFTYRAHHASVANVALFAHDSEAAIHASSDRAAEVAMVCIPMGSASAVSWVGRRRYELVPGESGFIAPHGIPGGVRWAAGSQSLNMTASQSELDDTLTVLTGARPGAKVRFDPFFSLTNPSTAAFRRLLRYVVSELDEGGLVGPALSRLGEALVAQLLCAQPHVHSALLAAPPHPDEPARVRRVAEYLEANATRGIHLSELAHVSGTSARNVQAGFRKHRGLSPMTFLRVQRLERARALLLADDRPVADVASACGFFHAGRFSVQYRSRFGETPTETRSRHKRR